MTNLDIIKYLATNNPKRLAELLDDIYCTAWNCGSYAAQTDGGRFSPNEIDDFNEWLAVDASKYSGLYYDEELEEWSKPINNPSIEITYPDNFVVEFPWDGKDPNRLWNLDNNYNIIGKTIDEIKLLESLIEVSKYSNSVYDNFRKEVCTNCADPNCLRSQVEICDCHKFENYFINKEN